MFIYGAAGLAARRAAGQNRDEMVIQHGPSLWSLMLEEMVYLLSLPRQRFLRRSANSVSVHPRASDARSPHPHD